MCLSNLHRENKHCLSVMLTDWLEIWTSATVERSGHLSPGGWIQFQMCVYVTSLLYEMIRSQCVCLHVYLCVAYVCIPVAWIGLCVCMCAAVQVCVCVCLLHNRLAPMWGSKSIIPAAFTYHFTELYVQCKQRLSLHANEPLSCSLHKDPFHSQHGGLPACWIWYPRLQVYSQGLCTALLSLTFHNGCL